MNEVMKCILERRSYRKYKSDQISSEALEAILQAALYAPNAGSRQSSIVVACQDNAINDALGRVNKDAYQGRISTGNSYISQEQPSVADDPALESGFYGAPTVLTFFGPHNFLYAEADCCVMAQNAMLAAHSLGIGSCMVMRAQDSFASELGQRLRREWGIDEKLAAKVHLILGYPEGVITQVKPRKEGRVVRVGG